MSSGSASEMAKKTLDATLDATKNVTEPRRAPFRPTRKSPIGRIISLGGVTAIVAGVVVLRLRSTTVTTAKVMRGTAIEAVYATGTVEASDRVNVKAKTSGSIFELKVKEGARVRKGELLAVIDSPSLKFELARGKAESWAASQQAGANAPQIAVLEAQARATQSAMKTAREDQERLTQLVSSGAATQSDLDRASARVEGLEAELAGISAHQRALRIDLSARVTGSNAAVDSLSAHLRETEVRSPLDGVVLSRSVELGEVVTVNQQIFKVGDVSNLLLECAIDESDIGKVSLGKRAAVSLYAFPQSIHRGEVIEILPDADRGKKSFLVKVKLESPPTGLRSGMSAEVNVIIDERKGALLAPAEAIDSKGETWMVRNNRAEKRILTFGIRDMLRVEVLGGADEGDRLVIEGGAGLENGARVRATEKAINLSAPQSSAAKPKAGL
ncbi:MAG: efflux RND transporter periplasmic adaptor subunit [Polyangiales bacterium]